MKRLSGGGITNPAVFKQYPKGYHLPYAKECHMRDRLDGMAKIFVYDEETMEKTAEKAMNPLGGPGKYEMEKRSIRALLPYGGDKLVVFIDDEAHLLDAVTMETMQTTKLPGMAETYAIDKDLTVCFSVDEKLYRIIFD